MHFEDGTLIIERELSTLDEMVVEFTEILDEEDVDYVIIAGYVAILAGRSRATEDIDVIVQELSENRTDRLASRFQDAGYWGVAEDLDHMYDRLTSDIATRVAERGTATPNFEIGFPQDKYDRASLENALTVRVSGHELSIGPLELQVAYKLRLGSQKDVEDALHLYHVFGDALNREALEQYVTDLGVEEAYDELRRA